MATFTTKDQVEQEVAMLRADPRYLSLLFPPASENIYKNYIRAVALVFDMPCDFIWSVDCESHETKPVTVIDHIINEDHLPTLPKIDENKPHKKFKTFWNVYEILTAEQVEYSVISMVWMYLFAPKGINYYRYNDTFMYAYKNDGELEYPEVAEARNEFRDYIRNRYASAELYYHRITSFLIKEDNYTFEYVDLKEANEQLWNAEQK